MSIPERMQSEIEGMRSGWWIYLIVGVMVIIAGLLAISIPAFTGLATQTFLGALLVVGGVGHLIHTIKSGAGAGRIVLGLVVTALYLWAGIMLILHPWVGLFMLTLVLAAFFVIAGILKFAAALENKHLPHWGWLLADGILSVVVGILIWAHWPGSALWAIGLLVGIELIFAGWTMVALAIAVHSLPATPGGRLAAEH